MRKYEVMVIVNPEVDDRQVAPLIDRHLKTLTNDGGTVDNIDIWGRRRLAYEINKKTEGIYVVLNVTSEPHTVQELDRLMTIDERIMRTKVMRPEAH